MGSTKNKTPKYYSLRIAINALNNIDEIVGYIAYVNYQPLNAIRVGNEIFKTINHIQKNPLVYRECEEIPTKSKMYRKAVCMSWLIVFRIKNNEITVLGIIHSARRTSRTKGLRRVK